MFDDNIEEREELSRGRLSEFADDTRGRTDATSRWIFVTSEFLLKVLKTEQDLADGTWDSLSLDTVRARNRELYADVAGDAYENSFVNPAVSVREFGEKKGQLIAAVSYELLGTIAWAFEGKRAFALSPMEMFIEMACAVKGDIPSASWTSLHDIFYWFVSDTSDDYIGDRTADMLVPGHAPFAGWIENADFQDPRFLYRTGEYVTEGTERLARAMASLDDAQIKKMAGAFTEGYRRGFELGRKDLSKKRTVSIRCEAGFERLVKEEIRQFREMGLESTIYRSAVSLINRRMDMRIGFFGARPNRQMEYDHRYDDALLLDAAFVERKLGALEHAYEMYRQEALEFGGPAVMDTFGEEPFSPVTKSEAPARSEAQQKLNLKYSAAAGEITNRYIPGEQRSFTIIAWPKPDIGADFDAILRDTVRLNTLDNDQYARIQQKITDALSGAAYAVVKGAAGNRTDLKISLYPVGDPDTQASFENCLADVNIPVGEVFTTPVLKGTEGVLHVSSVYLDGLRYDDLEVRFADGVVTDYGCSNFRSPEKGKAYFRENVLYGHKTLPMGEFAIGTNTEAYAFGRRYGIEGRLPILIAEKTGPHFALGDTCYSHEEDNHTYNPDGKEIIARENDFSRKRVSSPQEAYFNCHTDITVPYEEIGEITAVRPDGERLTIIRDGRFVLPGTEELNAPLDALKDLPEMS